MLSKYDDCEKSGLFCFLTSFFILQKYQTKIVHKRLQYKIPKMMFVLFFIIAFRILFFLNFVVDLLFIFSSINQMLNELIPFYIVVYKNF